MGRQVNFFMHPDDLPPLEAELRERWNLLFFPRSVDRAPIEPLETLKLDFSGLAPRDERVYAVLCSKYDAEYGFVCHYNARWRRFMICVQSSPVVEFHRSYLEGDTMLSGRMYFVPQSDPPDFTKWADAALRWVRRQYVRVGHSYAGPCAIKWRDKTGGQFKDFL